MRVVDDRSHIGTQLEQGRRTLTCPEGVPLAFQVAAAGNRFTALLLDMMAIFALIFGIALVFLMTGAITGLGLASAAGMVLTFVVVNFYFMFFELRMQGQTPGKRNQKLRVIDARGGPLTSEAIIARNLVRNIEIWLPMTAWLAPGSVYAWVPAGLLWLPVLWIILLMFVPLFNRDRLRIGDLIAGTMVVEIRRHSLGSDLSARGAKKTAAGYRFTQEQLEIYGRYELQVLEEILRERSRDRKVLAAATEKIRQKIGWESATKVEPRAFLEAFYAAQRQHLEQRLLMGEKRESKER